jgi:hypothetical protein
VLAYLSVMGDDKEKKGKLLFPTLGCCSRAYAQKQAHSGAAPGLMQSSDLCYQPLVWGATTSAYEAAFFQGKSSPFPSFWRLRSGL